MKKRTGKNLVWLLIIPLAGLLVILYSSTYLLNQSWIWPLVGIVFVYILSHLVNWRNDHAHSKMLLFYLPPYGDIFLTIVAALMTAGHFLFGINFTNWAEIVLVIIAIMIGYRFITITNDTES